MSQSLLLVLEHANLGWCEQKGLRIDPVHLTAERLHATAGEVDQPLGLTIAGLDGMEHDGTVLAHAEEDLLRIPQLARTENQQLLPSGSYGMFMAPPWERPAESRNRLLIFFRC